MKKIAVILSGCGHRDGAEITESVSALIALSQAEVDYQCYSPATDLTVVNHLTGQQTTQTRNVLEEAARICRGKIKDVKELDPNAFDGLVIPGGFGVALNLCTWAQDGAQCKVNPHVEGAIQKFYQQSKPIAAICIAPALIARVLGRQHVTVTIGEDADTIGEIIKTGAEHETCPVSDYITDRGHKIITTPAYMYNAKPHEVFAGIQKAVRELVEMA